jgi:hypothetical protein
MLSSFSYTWFAAVFSLCSKSTRSPQNISSNLNSVKRAYNLSLSYAIIYSTLFELLGVSNSVSFFCDSSSYLIED